MSAMNPPLPAASAPQYVVTTAAPTGKSQTVTYGLIIILLTLGMLFLVNRVKSLDLRLRNTELVMRDLVTENDVSELWNNFLNDKAGTLLWSEADIRSMIDDHVTDAMSRCACSDGCPAPAPAPAPTTETPPTSSD